MGRVFSGVQPTGTATQSGILHLGNYLGALKQWVDLQDHHECIYCVVDLHAITVPQNPAVLRNSIRSTVAAYLACGVDPERSSIFQQSRVAGHSQLAWVLTTQARMGWLNRMTQFKAKAGISVDEKLEQLLEAGLSISNTLYQQEGFDDTRTDEQRRAEAIEILDAYENTQSESIGAGLYMYPVLMAADILLYKATHVPVGDDQVQHLQLARQIVRSFNHQFGDIFPVPQDIISETGARIMSLRYPDRKMSKSTMETEEEVVFLTDTADQIAKKIKRATTDADLLPGEAVGLEGRLGAKNLMTIYAVLRGMTLDEACAQFGGQGFGKLKPAVTDALVDVIVPIGKRMREYIAHPEVVDAHLATGAAQVDTIAQQTMNQVYQAVGMR